MGDEKNMKLADDRTIEIRATPEQVYDYIETMPVKFPTFKLLDARPFLFVRIALVDGIKSALKVVRDNNYQAEMMKKESEPMKTGSGFGPFTLIEAAKPTKYYFSIASLFFNGETGYKLFPGPKGAILHFDLYSETSRIGQILWMVCIMPFHIILARIVLRNIKKGVESKIQ